MCSCPYLFKGSHCVHGGRARHGGAPSPPKAPTPLSEPLEAGARLVHPIHVISAGLLAVVHNTYAAASIAAAEMTKTTAMSTTAHM